MYQWGVLGTGAGTQAFCDALAVRGGSQLMMCCMDDKKPLFSRQASAAVSRCSFEDFVLDESIHLVYVGSGTKEAQARIEALLACKKAVVYEAVLGEKLSFEPLEKLSRKHETLLLEAEARAMLPSMVRARDLVSEGILGDVLHIHADSSQHVRYDPEHVFYHTQEGGIFRQHGRFPLMLMILLCGEPLRAVGQIEGMEASEERIMEQYALTLRYESGLGASLTASCNATGTNEAHVIGSTMRMQMEAPFYGSTRIMLYKRNKHSGLIKFDYMKDPLDYLIHEAQRCHEERQHESPMWTHAQSHKLRAFTTLCIKDAKYYAQTPM